MIRALDAIALGLVLAASAPATADPVTAPSPCSVDLVRAPEDTRKVIEAWLASARRCSVALEVRIVETRGGLYVLARDDRGTLRDRVVPDAQTAGALIASWADDGQPGPVASIDFHADVQLVPAAVPPAREPPSLEPIVDPTGGPGATPLSTTAEPRDDVPSSPRAHPHHWIGEFLGFGGGRSAFRALRLEVDVVRRGTWTGGVALYIGGETLDATTDSGLMETLELTDVGATAYAARSIAFAAWDVRPAVGLGVVRTNTLELSNAPGGGGFLETQRVTPFAEGSLLVSHAIVGSLAVSVGAIVTAYGQRFDAMIPSLQRRDVDALAVAGVRFGFL